VLIIADKTLNNYMWCYFKYD